MGKKITTLFFDIGGVLLQKNTEAYFKKLGQKLTIKQQADLTKKAISVFTHMDKLTDCNSGSFCPRFKGNPMPHDIHQWFKGYIPTDILLQKINTTIASMSDQDNFLNHDEKKLVSKTMHLDITAHEAVLLKEEIQPITSLLPKIREAKKDNLYKLIILTNIETKQYMPLLIQRFPHVFQPFDDIIASGDIHLVKPDPTFFTYALEKHALTPDECIYFDDQLENITSAEALGIHSFHVNKNDYSQVEKILKQFQII